MPFSCLYQYMFVEGLPWWLSSKESTCNAGSVPGLRKSPWRWKWQPTPVFLPEESHGQRGLVGYSSWGPKETSHTPVCWDDIKTWLDSRGLQVSLILPPSLESTMSFNSSSLRWFNSQGILSSSKELGFSQHLLTFPNQRNSLHKLVHVFGWLLLICYDASQSLEFAWSTGCSFWESWEAPLS